MSTGGNTVRLVITTEQARAGARAEPGPGRVRGTPPPPRDPPRTGSVGGAGDIPPDRGRFGRGLGRGVSADVRTTGGGLRGASRSLGVGASAGRALGGTLGGVFGGPIGFIGGLIGMDILLRDGINPALRSMQEAIVGVNRSLEQLGQFSGAIAGAQAQRQVTLTQEQFRRARDLEDLTVQSINAQTELSIEFRRTMDQLLQVIMPSVIQLLEDIADVMRAIRPSIEGLRLLSEASDELAEAVVEAIANKTGFDKDTVEFWTNQLRRLISINPLQKLSIITDMAEKFLEDEDYPPSLREREISAFFANRTGIGGMNSARFEQRGGVRNFARVR